MSNLTWIGKSVRRVDGKDKVSGRLVYPSDISAEGMLHCRPVLAPHPHAQILSIDARLALEVPGVVRVLTHNDVPGSKVYGYRDDHPVLCIDKTRHNGDMVAVVVAESEAAAEQGAKRVKIDCQPLPLVTSPEEALQPRSARVHPAGNILHEIHHKSGDVSAVFQDKNFVTVERTYEMSWVDHAFLETEAGVAFPENGGVKVIAGGQNVFYSRDQVARCLALPPEKVHMLEPFTGGAFGGKGDVTTQIVVGLAALLTGKPCRMAWTRAEHFLAGVKRHPAKIRVKTAAGKNGQLAAIEARILVDSGAYAVFGDVILEVMAENMTGLYRFPNVKVDAWTLFTNNPVGGAFRGFGATQACLALESQISELAHKLGIDQLEFRKQNLLKQGEISGMGHELLLPHGVAEVLEAAAAHPLWKDRRQYTQPAENIRRGVGVALAVKGYGIGVNDAPDFTHAILELSESGRPLIKCGYIDLGQGSFTVLAQVAAEVLKCDPAQVDVYAADTFESSETGSTASSRVTYAGGRAVAAAAEELALKMRSIVSMRLETPVEAILLKDGRIWNTQTSESFDFKEVAQLADKPLRVEVRQRIPYSETPSSGPLKHPHVLYSSNLQLVLSAVDLETGEIRVEKVVVFPEAGRVINRHGLEGQCEGGVAQGIGYALMEQVLVKDAVIVNNDLNMYAAPTPADIPPVEVIPVEVPEASGPFGAKGAAENTTIPTAPAILDAIEDAIGIRMTTIPVIPEKVIQVLLTTHAQGR